MEDKKIIKLGKDYYTVETKMVSSSFNQFRLSRSLST